MSQARVTDFFSQRKKGAAAPAKADSRRPAACSPPLGRAALHGSAVHEEFLRVIDEAAGLHESESTDKLAASPRTPKRSSAECPPEAAAEHSSAKRRRQAGGLGAARGCPAGSDPPRSRKKLLLTADTSQTLQKEDIAALKSRLQRIKKQTDEISSCVSSSSSHHDAAPTAAGALRFSVGRAKELAERAQRRTQSESAEGQRTQSESAEGQRTQSESAEGQRTQSQSAEGQRTQSQSAEGQRTQSQSAEGQRTQSQSAEGQRTQDSGAELPGFQRFHSLAQPVLPGLCLPFQYKLLAEMFRSADTVVAMLYNRSETATFSKIQQGVRDMMHRRFEESHMAQIKSVFPEAYAFKREKNLSTFSGASKGSYQLTVEPVVHSEQNEARPSLSASRLLERRRTFHQKLLSVVKRHHAVFLSSLVPPVSVPEDKLTRWHPRFSVDAVPAIPASSLPPVPHAGKPTTAQEVLLRARSLITPKMEKALVSLASNADGKRSEGHEAARPPETAAPSPQPPPPLKGVSKALLERIRAKEAQKLQASMTRNPAQEERLLMMSRLGELARILRSVFVSEKRPALIMETACSRMVASYRSALSSGDMEKHVRLLAEVAPDWLTIHPIRKDFYLKLNKQLELSVVLDTLSQRMREEERL